MRLAKIITAVAVASMATAPAFAAPAAPAAKLSLSQAASVRGATTAKKSNKIAPAILIGVLAVAAVAGGVVAIADSDDTPDSN